LNVNKGRQIFIQAFEFFSVIACKILIRKKRREMKQGKKISVLISFFLVSIANSSNRYVDCCSSSSSDLNAGGINSTYKTIQKASSVLQAGDTCFIRAGIYRETISPGATGTSTAPIAYLPFGGEKVVVNGSDFVSGTWTSEGSNRYSMTFPVGSLTKIYQVFMDGVPLSENTWPKRDAGFLPSQFRKITSATHSSPQWCIEDSAIPNINQANYWTGASIWVLLGVKSSAHILPISAHSSGKVCFNHWADDSAYWPIHPKGNTSYYSIIKRPFDYLLLEANQWSFDSSSRKLNIRFPSGDLASNHRIEVRTRLLGVNLQNQTGLGYIHVSGINFFGAGIDFGNATNSKINRAQIEYVTPFFYSAPPVDKLLHSIELSNLEWRGINLSGQSNYLTNSVVTGSWADGISISGTSNTADNNVINKTNWIAGSFAGVSLWDSSHSVIHNTVKSTGRDGIYHYYAKASKISFNRISDFGKLTDDFGGTYTVQTNGKGTEISYNWIGPAADTVGKFPGENADSIKPKIVGIYLDNVDTNFFVYNNAVLAGYSGYSMRMNGDQKKIKIYHNTLLDAWGAIISLNKFSTSMDSVEIKNNIMPKGFGKSDGGGGWNWVSNIILAGNDTSHFDTSYFVSLYKNALDLRASPQVQGSYYVNSGASLGDCHTISGKTICLYSSGEGRGPITGSVADIGAYEKRTLPLCEPNCNPGNYRYEWVPGANLNPNPMNSTLLYSE
jgi:parallel beta-helix repeat protein